LQVAGSFRISISYRIAIYNPRGEKRPVGKFRRPAASPLATKFPFDRGKILAQPAVYPSSPHHLCVILAEREAGNEASPLAQSARFGALVISPRLFPNPASISCGALRSVLQPPQQSTVPRIREPCAAPRRFGAGASPSTRYPRLSVASLPAKAGDPPPDAPFRSPLRARGTAS
jgi:hypothetical protein